MTLTELFSLPIGTRLALANSIPSLTDHGLRFVHFRSPDQVILRRDGDDGYWDEEFFPDSFPWAVEDLTVLEFSGFPPVRDGRYIYREFQDLKTCRATIESHVYVIDSTLSCEGHRHDLRPVNELTVGPRALGEWAFVHGMEVEAVHN